MSKEKIAGIVVFFNPDKMVLNNIKTYIDQVSKIYVIDNSEIINYRVIEELKCFNKIEYVRNSLNIGIASALNIGIDKALFENFEYVIAFDQDSQASPNMVSNMFEVFSQDSKIVLVAPLINNGNRRMLYSLLNTQKKVLSVWTSGNLIKLNIFKIIGGFEERLFIDYVDHEFCLRLNSMGHKIRICNNAMLIHRLGEMVEKRILFRNVYPTNHSSVRHYYMTRNRFYVKKKYKSLFPEFIKQDRHDFWGGFIKILFFERHKIKKIYMMILGYLDYKRNRFGSFNNLHHNK